MPQLLQDTGSVLKRIREPSLKPDKHAGRWVEILHSLFHERRTGVLGLKSLVLDIGSGLG